MKPRLFPVALVISGLSFTLLGALLYEYPPPYFLVGLVTTVLGMTWLFSKETPKRRT